MDKQHKIHKALWTYPSIVALEVPPSRIVITPGDPQRRLRAAVAQDLRLIVERASPVRDGRGPPPAIAVPGAASIA